MCNQATPILSLQTFTHLPLHHQDEEEDMAHQEEQTLATAVDQEETATAVISQEAKVQEHQRRNLPTEDLQVAMHNPLGQAALWRLTLI